VLLVACLLSWLFIHLISLCEEEEEEEENLFYQTNTT